MPGDLLGFAPDQLRIDIVAHRGPDPPGCVDPAVISEIHNPFQNQRIACRSEDEAAVEVQRPNATRPFVLALPSMRTVASQESTL